MKVHNQITCSRECFKKMNNSLKQEKLKDPEYRKVFYEKKRISSINDYAKHKERCLLNAKKLRYTKTCKECGKDFKAYSKTLLLCGKECQSIGLKRDRIGENNPAYRNGIYKKGGMKTIHNNGNTKFNKLCSIMNNEMIEKHGYRFCEFCGINNSLRWEHHHIVFRSEKPGHEFLHDKINTIHLCIKCHNEFHKNKSKRDSLMKDRGLDKIFGIFVE